MKDNTANPPEESAVQDEILQEDDVDSNYEPSEGEIIEYAKYLGMDLEEDKEFFWIAKEGLKAPLPSPWKACHTKEGEIYYFNFQNGESQWDHPLDNFYKQKFSDIKEKEKSIDTLKPQRNQQNKFKLNLPIGQLNPYGQPTTSAQPAGGNMNSSNIKPHNVSALQDSGISGLSYSHNTAPNENVSDIQKKADFDTGKPLDLELDKEEVNESLEFSNLDEDPRSKRSPKTRALEDIEKEYKNKVSKLEEELDIKFNHVVSDCETNYQKEAQRINKNFETELKNLKENTFGKNGNDQPDIEFETKKRQIEEEHKKEVDAHIASQLESIKRDNEKKMRELEEDFNKDLERFVQEIKTNNDMEIINQKRSLKRKVDEVALQRDGLIAKKDIEPKDFSSNLDKRKADVRHEFERKIRDLENEEAKKLTRELEIYKKELSFIVDREKAGREPSTYRRNRANDMGLRKIELRELYLKKVDLEKHRLYDENERNIREMLEIEKKRIEENSGKAFEPGVRSEYEKKYNSLNQEKNAAIENNKRRLDEAQSIMERKFENDKKYIGREYRNIIDRLTNEIAYLVSEIGQKEASRGVSSRLIKEIEESEKESIEKDKKIARLAKELEDLSQKVTENAQILEKFNVERNKFNEVIKKKNEMLVKIDDMQRRIEDTDKHIDNVRVAPSVSRLNDTTVYNTTKNSTERLSQNLSMVSLARLVKEVEDIRGMIKKKKASRSLSAEKILVKKKFTKNNVTIDHGKMYSFDDDEVDEDSDFDFEVKGNKNILKGINQHSSVHQIKKLPISNLNRLEEINDLENQELSEIPSTASFKNGQFNNQRINWTKLIPAEKENIQRWDEILKKKKLDIKEVQSDILREQAQYKQDYNQYKAGYENFSYQKKTKLDLAKKSLNSKIQEYNLVLNQIINQESLLNKKKELQRAMEIGLNKILTDQSSDQNELEFLYRSYRDIKIELEDNEPLTSEPRAIEPFGESCDEAKMPPKDDMRIYNKQPLRSNLKSTELSREKRHPIKIEDEEENSQFAGNVSDLRDPSDYSRVRSRGAFFEERSYIHDRSYALERNSMHDRQRLLNLRHQLKAEKYFDRYDDLIRKYSSHY